MFEQWSSHELLTPMIDDLGVNAFDSDSFFSHFLSADDTDSPFTSVQSKIDNDCVAALIPHQVDFLPALDINDIMDLLTDGEGKNAS
jgi:hypothetical protein